MCTRPQFQDKVSPASNGLVLVSSSSRPLDVCQSEVAFTMLGQRGYVCALLIWSAVTTVVNAAISTTPVITLNNITPGKPVTLIWTGTQGHLTLILMNGPTTGVRSVSTIACTSCMYTLRLHISPLVKGIMLTPPLLDL